MSCANELNCCPLANIDYSAETDSSLVSVQAVVSPPEAGTTDGSGLYAVGAAVSLSTEAALPINVNVGVDMVFCLDTTGTMAADAVTMIEDFLDGLETRLQSEGIGSASVANRYGLLLFGWDDKHTEIDVPLGPLQDVVAALPGIVVPSGGTEDGYRPIHDAIDGFSWRTSAQVSKVIVLITDEGRNNVAYINGAAEDGVVGAGGSDHALDFAAIKAELVDGNYLLVSVVGDAGLFRLRDTGNNIVMGYDYNGVTYDKDGSGGFTTGTGGHGDPAAYHNTPPGPPYPSYPGDPNLGGTWVGAMDAYEQLAINDDVMGYVFDVFQYRFEDDKVTPSSSNTKLSFVNSMVPAIAEGITRQLAWQFQGWYDSDNTLVSSDNPYSFNASTDVVYTAKYEL